MERKRIEEGMLQGVSSITDRQGLGEAFFFLTGLAGHHHYSLCEASRKEKKRWTGKFGFLFF